MSEPTTVVEVDKELRDYRTILRTVSTGGRVAVWEQIDVLLELRRKYQLADRRRARKASH